MAHPDLAGLVGARICHDLISPIGAIGNGVELLGMTGEPPSPELQLIADSVAGASATVRFLRVAFGRATPGQTVAQDEIRTVLRDRAANSRMRYDWQVTGALPRPEVRCAFLTMLCLESALPAGGTITATAASDQWRLEATGPRVGVDPALWAELTSGTPGPVEFTPSDVHFALLPEAARQMQREARATAEAERVVVTF